MNNRYIFIFGLVITGLLLHIEYRTTNINDRIDQLETTMRRVKTQSALAINWEPRVAANMLTKQVEILRQDKATYFSEIAALMKAFAEDEVTQNYDLFCEFWVNTLGWHPFLD